MLRRCTASFSDMESRTATTGDAIHQVGCLKGERLLNLDDNEAFRTLQGGVGGNVTISATATVCTRRSAHQRTRLALIAGVY